jgi:hypothetical protein
MQQMAQSSKQLYMPVNQGWGPETTAAMAAMEMGS